MTNRQSGNSSSGGYVARAGAESGLGKLWNLIWRRRGDTYRTIVVAVLIALGVRTFFYRALQHPVGLDEADAADRRLPLRLEVLLRLQQALLSLVLPALRRAHAVRGARARRRRRVQDPGGQPHRLHQARDRPAGRPHPGDPGPALHQRAGGAARVPGRRPGELRRRQGRRSSRRRCRAAARTKSGNAATTPPTTTPRSSLCRPTITS